MSGCRPAARVTVAANGGVALIYVERPDDHAAVEALVRGQVGVARVFDRAALAAAGADPDATLAVEAAPGYGFGAAFTGPVVVPSEGKGTHGWPPDDPAMAASFLAIGPPLVAQRLGAIRMVDLAPTFARWLRVPLSGATGTAIEGLTR